MREIDFGVLFVVAVLLTEIVTEIVTSSAILSKVRKALWGKTADGKEREEGRWLGVLLSCGYCFSVWAAVFWAYILRLHGPFKFLGIFEPLVWGLIAHRAANVLHVIFNFLSKIRIAIVNWAAKKAL